MQKLRLIGIALLVAALGAGAAVPRPAAAEDFTKEAGTFVQSLGDQAIEIITDKSLDPAGREHRFHEMFVTRFDVPAIGRFVLGRYWRTATDAQKAEFLKLFEDMIVKTYNNRFTEYKGEQFAVIGTRADHDSAMVTANIAQPNGRPPIKVEWRVLNEDGKPKIVDVVIEGVSMSVTQQQEFGSVIQRNGGQVDGLLATMRERVQQQSQAAAKS
jgi:phospholipid transport system substrate-binding protein